MTRPDIVKEAEALLAGNVGTLVTEGPRVLRALAAEVKALRAALLPEEPPEALVDELGLVVRRAQIAEWTPDTTAERQGKAASRAVLRRLAKRPTVAPGFTPGEQVTREILDRAKAENEALRDAGRRVARAIVAGRDAGADATDAQIVEADAATDVLCDLLGVDKGRCDHKEAP